MICSTKKKNLVVLEGFYNANWNIWSCDSRSTTGYILTLDDDVICWKLEKQIIIANSTWEAKLIALTLTSEKANWLRDLLSQISYFEKLISNFNSLW